MGYFVRKRKNGWAMILTDRRGGRYHAPNVPESEYPHLLLKPTMTLEEAKSQAKRLNRDLHTYRWMQKREAIQERLRSEAREKVIFLPEDLCRGFEKEIQTHPDPKRMRCLWKAARTLIKAVRIPPEEWKRRAQTVYNYFEEKHLSPAYAKKIIRIMNLWGNFYSARTGVVYANLKCPNGFAAGRILRSYRAHRGCDKASDGLTRELLDQIRNSLSLKQYHWIFVSLWFGLRPQEVDSLTQGPQFFYFHFDQERGIEILNVLQTKLSNLPEEDQWKSIPILYPEQEAAARMIHSGSLEPPLPKTIKRYTLGNHHRYAGRKGFGPLMWELGHDVVEVSSWLGHKSIDRTFRDYMKWKRLKLRTRPPQVTTRKV